MRHHAVAAGALLLATACSMKGAGVIPQVPVGPSLTVPGLTTTAPPEEGADALRPVPGRTTTTGPSLHPGRARLSGTVTGPGGPVPSATVRVERLVGRAAAKADVVTGADGAWVLGDLRGGGYRVRAWKAPDLTGPPVQFFLNATEQRVVELPLTPVSGTRVAPSVPGRLAALTPFNVSVRLTSPTVDPEGALRALPQPNVELALSVGGTLTLLSPTRVLTDASGTARWQLYCSGVGEASASVTLRGTDVRPLNMPRCPEPVSLLPPPPEAVDGG